MPAEFDSWRGPSVRLRWAWEEMLMIIQRVLLLSVAALAVSVSASHAGPCSDEIARVQARIGVVLGANAGAGPSARESTAATAHRQPTPRSVGAAEDKLGELPPQKVEAVTSAMERARAADRAGDRSACEQALADAQRALDP